MYFNRQQSKTDYSRLSVNRRIMGFCISIFLALFSLLFLSFSNPANKFSLVCKIPFMGGSFTTDNLQNLYLFHGSTLRKYNSQGKLVCTYDDKSYGNITSVDVNDPLKILVFYKDFPEVVLLDNTLSVNGNPFSPSDAGFPLATLACTSHDNSVWLYDAQNFQLIRIDVNLAVEQKTGNLAQVLGISLNPDYLMEYNNYVYLNDSAQGILVFDSFGTYYKTIPITGLTSFEVRGDDLYYILPGKGNIEKNNVHSFHLKTIMQDDFLSPHKMASEVRIEKNLLFEKYQDTLRVYQIGQ
jgi:WD40 repeat protein